VDLYKVQSFVSKMSLLKLNSSGKSMLEHKFGRVLDDDHEKTLVLTNCQALIAKRGFTLLHIPSLSDSILYGEKCQEASCLVIKFFESKINKQDIQLFIQQHFELYPFSFKFGRHPLCTSLILVFRHMVSVNINDIKNMNFPIQMINSSILSVPNPEMGFKYELLKGACQLIGLPMMTSEDPIVQIYGFKSGDHVLVTRPNGEKSIRCVA